jgi:hypothetical protein
MTYSMCCLKILFLTLLLVPVAQCDPAPVPLIVQNDQARLVFQPETGVLTEFSGHGQGGNLLVAGATTELWSLTCMDGQVLLPGMAAHTSYAFKDADHLAITWTDLQQDEAPDLKISALIELAKDEGVVRWRIRVVGLGKLALRDVHFPRLAPLRPLDGESLAVPVWIGEKTMRARQFLNPVGAAPGRLEWEYPGTLSMQCLTFYGPNQLGVLLEPGVIS